MIPIFDTPIRTYRGFPVVRMERHPQGTMPICAVPCGKCGTIHEKSGWTVRKAPKKGFHCPECASGPETKTCEICMETFRVDYTTRENRTCGDGCASVLRARGIRAAAKARKSGRAA